MNGEDTSSSIPIALLSFSTNSQTNAIRLEAIGDATRNDATQTRPIINVLSYYDLLHQASNYVFSPLRKKASLALP